MMATFVRLTDSGDKAGALSAVVSAVNHGTSPVGAFCLSPAEFAGVPGAPFSYWLSDGVRGTFSRHQRFETENRRVRAGLQTSDDGRFLRLHWEHELGWPQFVKGGRATVYHAPTPWVINYTDDGRELKAWITVVEKGGHWSRAIRSDSEYLKPGMTWPLRARRFTPQAMPAGSVFSVRGYAAFVGTDERLALLGLTRSTAFDFLFKASLGRAGFPEFVVGVFQQMPWPTLAAGTLSSLSALTLRAWSAKRSLDTITETSHAFFLPALLQVDGATVADRAAAWSTHVAEVEAELATIQREIDDIAFRLYGIEGEDRARIEAESGSAPAAATSDDAEPGEEPEAAEYDGDDEDDDGAAADAATLATELLSWAVGVAVGRFDIDYAGGLREPPPEPGPFDPLPARSPGMSPDDSRAVEVLVDEEGHPEDLVQGIANVFAHAFGPWHDERLDEAVQFAGASDLRTWLRRSFFPFHLRRYSKSRRKAPIWWPLSTASGSYSLWVAWPRLTRDTLFRLTSEQEPYIAAKVAQETRKLTSLKQDAGKAPTNAQAKAIGAQEEFVAELTALRDELAMIAPMWNPVHDDGVVLHAALLWRVTRDAGWQKECREKWEGLAAGKYDWAHIAMHLWPERVVPKCREDRSLAIAHGLEERFWVEIAGKWRLRDGTDQAMNEEIAARSSAAVKKALRAFTEAPAPARGRRGKKGA